MSTQVQPQTPKPETSRPADQCTHIQPAQSKVRAALLTVGVLQLQAMLPEIVTSQRGTGERGEKRERERERERETGSKMQAFWVAGRDRERERERDIRERPRATERERRGRREREREREKTKTLNPKAQNPI